MTGCNSFSCSASAVRGRFQSTAGAMTGCNSVPAWPLARVSRFQSTAGPMTGCNPRARPGAPAQRVVSIHSRPHDRLQRRATRCTPTGLRVSIHSRPHDRLQLSLAADHLDRAEFQSTAGPMTGCNPANPDRSCPPRGVSIHSRPHDRLQPAGTLNTLPPLPRFNPQPAP